jgi:polycomb protein EED
MVDPEPARGSWAFPKLKCKFKTEVETERFTFYDVKFFPWARPDATDAVFALISPTKVWIGQLSDKESAVVTFLHELVDRQETDNEGSAGLNSCSWCYVDAHTPLLAVAGASGQLKILDAVEGEHYTTLVGHGYGTINDIATHPTCPWIIATASMDRTIRIWDIRRPANGHLPACVIICGQTMGHLEGILTVSWHAQGRYIVTGGHDQKLCIWTLPDLTPESRFWQDISPAHRKRSSLETITIYYPHFITSAVHSNFVDCARFFGDLIMSKAAGEDKVVLWKVNGFNSARPAPTSLTAPKTKEYLETRNGFMRVASVDEKGLHKVEVAEAYRNQPPYERLLEFHTPKVDPFYIRFGLLLPSPQHPHVHPTLAVGNTGSEVRFWDITRLSLGHGARGFVDESRTRQPASRTATPGLPPPSSRLSLRRGRLSDVLSEASSEETSTVYSPDSPGTPGTSTTSSPRGTPSSREGTEEEATREVSYRARDREKYGIHDPHDPLKPHARVSLIDMQYKNMSFFSARATDWSPCGRWCIVAGESAKDMPTGREGVGGFAVLHRP